MTLIGEDLAARVLERALTHGGEFGEVYAEDRYGFGLGIDDSKIERPQTGSNAGRSQGFACPKEPWPYGCKWREPPARRVTRGSRPAG